MDFSEQDYLNLCKSRIEEKFRLGNGDQSLKQRDFEYLIDLIEETSGIKLSVSTLKRIWRKTEEQNPHPSTLDALVSILGCKDWLDFKVQNAPTFEKAPSQTVDAPQEPEQISSRGRNETLHDETGMVSAESIESNREKTTEKSFRQYSKSKRVKVLITASLVVIALTSLLITSFTSKTSGDATGSSNILFSVSNTVSTGVPNTIIFNYDVSDIQADSFFIQRDWDPSNIVAIDPETNFSTNVYFLPGFHRARLIADGRVIKTEEVNIQTDGWLGVAFYNNDEPPIPIPRVQNENGFLSIRETDMIENGANMERVQGGLLINIGDFGNLDSDNFVAETRFRLRELSTAACYGMQFTIHTEANIFFSQYGPMGCVGDAELLIGENFFSGSNNDLSAFGTDVFEWQNVSMRIENKHATLLLNEEVAFETTFTEDFGRIVGIDYRFDGLGDVDFLRLKELDGRVVFEDEF